MKVAKTKKRILQVTRRKWLRRRDRLMNHGIRYTETMTITRGISDLVGVENGTEQSKAG